MSDGGKGSAPRPFSVTQEEYDNRWDTIFGRDKPANLDCHRCFKESGGQYLNRMILCPECGNKRCPKASDHELECTGSNEPGQTGSVY
jgi:Zn finger protein HypA/HybF involved in hydrogenase expression